MVRFRANGNRSPVPVPAAVRGAHLLGRAPAPSDDPWPLLGPKSGRECGVRVLFHEMFFAGLDHAVGAFVVADGSQANEAVCAFGGGTTEPIGVQAGSRRHGRDHIAKSAKCWLGAMREFARFTRPPSSGFVCGCAGGFQMGFAANG